jgi:hypothetical protein
MTLKIIHVIGNGESRKSVNIDELEGFKIGCNAAYRDFNLDCLVAVDHRMVREAIDAGEICTIYTRTDWLSSFTKDKNVVAVPDLPYKGSIRQDDPWNWGSGSHASNLAGKFSPIEIHLWGVDLYSNTPFLNNLYKDTTNYERSSHHSVDPSYWIYQLAKCFHYYPNSTWIQHQSANWKIPAEWKIYTNFKFEVL